VRRNNLARLMPDGSVDPDFQNGFSGANGPISSIVLQSGGTAVLGGFFDRFNDQPVASLAKVWLADFPPVIKDVTAVGSEFSLTWYAISNRNYRVQYDNFLTGRWVDLVGDILATNAIANKSDPVANESQRFYRVIQLP